MSTKTRLRRLRWLGIVLPMGFLVLVQASSMLFVMPALGTIYGHIWSLGLFALGVVIFSTLIFEIVEEMQQRIVRQNEELSAFNAVSTAVSGSLQLEEAVTGALGNVLEVTRAGAAEIVVESDDPSTEPLRFFRGAARDLESISDACDSDHDHGWAAGEAGGVRIVALPGTAQPEAAEGLGYSTFACVPLRARNSVFGAMRLVAGPDSHLEAGSSERLLAAIGNQIAVAIEASRLYRDATRRAKEAEALYEIGLNITSLQDIQKTLHTIVERASEVVASETAALCFVRGNGGGMELASRCGPEEAFLRSPEPVPPFPAPLADGGTSPSELRMQPCEMIVSKHRACHLSTPLLVGERAIGELCVSSRKARAFNPHQRQLLSGLADMAAIAINNARLLEGERNVAVLEERHRLAREMHDSLAQVLGYLHLKAQVAKRALARWDSAKALDELEGMASLAHEAYGDVRAAILDLRETVMPGAGIVSALREYVQKFRCQTGVEVEFAAEGDPMPQLSPDVEVQLLRVIQEAMTNVRKHAEAAGAWVRVVSREGAVSISVEDNGRGFDPEVIQRGEGRRFGVQVMRERVERVGGRFEIESSPGRGTTVRIHFASREQQS